MGGSRRLRSGPAVTQTAGYLRRQIGGRAIWSFAVVLVLALIGLGALYALYWLIRLAVRHGLDDARRQREQQAREESGWDPGRY
jgi:hypothetical protein